MKAETQTEEESLSLPSEQEKVEEEGGKEGEELEGEEEGEVEVEKDGVHVSLRRRSEPETKEIVSVKEEAIVKISHDEDQELTTLSECLC